MLERTYFAIPMLCLFAIFYWWLTKLYKTLLSRSRQGHFFLDPTSLSFLHKLFTIFAIFIFSLCFLQFWGFTIWPFLTFGGIGAAFLAFASKDVGTNFFSGLMLHITRPFVLQDTVELPGRKILGTVEKMGWCLTSLQDAHKRPVYVPNSLFSQEVLINWSRIENRYLEQVLRLRYQEKEEIRLQIERIREFLEKHPKVNHKLPLQVFLKNITLSVAEIEVKLYTQTSSYEELMGVKQDLFLYNRTV